MDIEQEHLISCPYCGESINVLLDTSGVAAGGPRQEYIEDCQVCCRPINFQISRAMDNSIELNIYHENE